MSPVFLQHPDSFLLGLLFDPEDGDEIFLRNMGFPTEYTTLFPRR
jgi:hypothetical protein